MPPGVAVVVGVEQLAGLAVGQRGRGGGPLWVVE
jgi:hypothetical protein